MKFALDEINIKIIVKFKTKEEVLTICSDDVMHSFSSDGISNNYVWLFKNDYKFDQGLS